MEQIIAHANFIVVEHNESTPTSEATIHLMYACVPGLRGCGRRHIKARIKLHVRSHGLNIPTTRLLEGQDTLGKACGAYKWSIEDVTISKSDKQQKEEKREEDLKCM